jgi:hypothetical protein
MTTVISFYKTHPLLKAYFEVVLSTAKTKKALTVGENLVLPATMKK